MPKSPESLRQDKEIKDEVKQEFREAIDLIHYVQELTEARVICQNEGINQLVIALINKEIHDKDAELVHKYFSHWESQVTQHRMGI